MVRPQNEDLNRSGTTPLDPDSIGGRLEARDQPRSDDRTGAPVPPENQPGHHPDTEQDQPDGDAFVARFSGQDEAEPDDDAEPDDQGSRAELVARARETASTVGHVTTAFVASARRVGRVTVTAIREEIDLRGADRENDDD